MTHFNAIIVGSAIVVAGAVITFNLPRYQYASTIVRSVDSSGSEKVEEREIVFDMVSAELHERQRLVLVFAPTNAVAAYGNVHKPTTLIPDFCKGDGNGHEKGRVRGSS